MANILQEVSIPIGENLVQLRDWKRYGREKIDPNEGKINTVWAEFFNAQGSTIDLTQTRVANATVTAQLASIGATDITEGTLNAGLYVLMYHAAITQAASTSSSLTVVVDWVDGGVAKSYTGSAITGNTTATYQSGAPGEGTDPGSGLIHVDGSTAVRYSTTYVSVGGTVMKYALYVVLSRVLV